MRAPPFAAFFVVAGLALARLYRRLFFSSKNKREVLVLTTFVLLSFVRGISAFLLLLLVYAVRAAGSRRRTWARPARSSSSGACTCSAARKATCAPRMIRSAYDPCRVRVALPWRVRGMAGPGRARPGAGWQRRCAVIVSIRRSPRLAPLKTSSRLAARKTRTRRACSSALRRTKATSLALGRTKQRAGSRACTRARV